jgi:hypothetical protein
VGTPGAVPADPPNYARLPGDSDPAWGMAARFEFVVIDWPILSGLVDRVLLALARGTTPRGELRTRRIPEAPSAKILGMAVSKLDPFRPGYGDSDYSKCACK